MNRFAALTGRSYHLFDYVGALDADRVIVLMGSGAEAVQETVEYLLERGEKVGVIKVRLFRPFSVERFIQAIPPTVRAIAVLDRTKEPGAIGEPLYQDAVTAISEALAAGTFPSSKIPKLVGGRNGLSSKEFTPAMIQSIFTELKKEKPKNHFTVGITDDVTQTHLNYDPAFSTEPEQVFRGVCYGLGSDGTVSANKNSIKIIGEETSHYAQGYFVYDSKKAGSVTISHLRFGPKPIRSTYLIHSAQFIACHQFVFLERYDMLQNATPGATFLLNSPYGPDEVWDHLPQEVQSQLIETRMRFYVIDAYKVARETGMGGRINTIMQTCFFAISGILARDETIAKIKKSIEKTYGKKGDVLVQRNFEAIDKTPANLFEVLVPGSVSSSGTDVRQRLERCQADGQDPGCDQTVSVLQLDGSYGQAPQPRWDRRFGALQSLLSAGYRPRLSRSLPPCAAEYTAGDAASHALDRHPLWTDRSEPRGHRRDPHARRCSQNVNGRRRCRHALFDSAETRFGASPRDRNSNGPVDGRTRIQID